MCSATSLNSIINNGETTFSNQYATVEDCEPAIPVANCDAATGWEEHIWESTWAYFDATSSIMELSLLPFDGNDNLHSAIVAIWKAANCETLKAGEANLLYANFTCHSGELVIDLADLEVGQRYFVELGGWWDYRIQLGLPSCEDEHLTLANIDQPIYQAEKTLTSTATINSDLTTFRAGASITLAPGFSTSAGVFLATIQPCSLSPIQPIDAPLPIEQAKVVLAEETIRSEEKVSLQIVPNPVTHSANIQFYLPETASVQIFIFDSNGRLLTQEEGAPQQGWQSTQLDASNLPAGIYFVGLQTEKGRWMEKVVVAR